MSGASESPGGRVAVTGANRGIGATIALELARRGCTVACLTRSGTSPPVPQEEPALAGRLEAIVCDVTDRASLDAALTAAAAREPLTALVNNAGLHLVGPSESFGRDEFEQVLGTNVTGVFLACQAAYPHLRARGGTIVNLGSFFDRMGVPHNAAYAASKAAVAALTRCLAVEWAPAGIRVLNVAPGYVETDLNRDYLSQPRTREYLDRRLPLKRAGTAQEVARLVAALLAEEIPYLTGETIYLDGAHGIAH